MVSCWLTCFLGKSDLRDFIIFFPLNEKQEHRERSNPTQLYISRHHFRNCFCIDCFNSRSTFHKYHALFSHSYILQMCWSIKKMDWHVHVGLSGVLMIHTSWLCFVHLQLKTWSFIHLTKPDKLELVLSWCSCVFLHPAEYWLTPCCCISGHLTVGSGSPYPDRHTFSPTSSVCMYRCAWRFTP